MQGGCFFNFFFVLFVCFTVGFRSCDGNKKIHFGSSEPEDFRVGEDGVVYAERSFQLSAEPTEFVVSAQDKETQQEWQMRVKLTPEPAFTGASEKVKQELNAACINVSPQREPKNGSLILPVMHLSKNQLINGHLVHANLEL